MRITMHRATKLIFIVMILVVALSASDVSLAQGTPPPRDTPTPGSPPRSTPTAQATATATLDGTPARATPTESISSPPARGTPTVPPSSTAQPPAKPDDPQETPLPTPALLPVTGDDAQPRAGNNSILLPLILIVLGATLLASVGRSHKHRT